MKNLIRRRGDSSLRRRKQFFRMTGSTQLGIVRLRFVLRGLGREYRCGPTTQYTSIEGFDPGSE